MYSVTLQRVILKTLLNHFILKHFENDSKVFLKWVVWKRPIEIKKTIWVVLFQILFVRCSKCFEDILQKFENFGSKVCNNLHLEMEHFWLWIRTKFDFKTKLEKKRFELISKIVILKEVFQNGLKGLKTIWFDLILQKFYSKKNLNMCLTSKENGNWKLTLFISKVVWNWFGLISGIPKEFIQNDLKMKFECFICFLKSWKSLVWNRFQKNLSWFVYSLSEIWL